MYQNKLVCLGGYLHDTKRGSLSMVNGAGVGMGSLACDAMGQGWGSLSHDAMGQGWGGGPYPMM